MVITPVKTRLFLAIYYRVPMFISIYNDRLLGPSYGGKVSGQARKQPPRMNGQRSWKSPLNENNKHHPEQGGLRIHLQMEWEITPEY